MKKVKIKFEVIVPCFNAESTIERTLDSMINQTYPNWRVWFVNDGSTDKSLDIAYRKSLVDSKIKIFSGSNQGVSAALNYGRAKVLEEGDDNSIVSCCGSDDWYYPQHFEIYAEEFEKYPEMDFLYSDVDCLFPNGEKATPYGIAYHEVFDPSRLQFENPIYAPAAAWKLKCFSVGEFDSRLDSIEDWDFNCRVAKAGYKMIHLKSTLTAVTVRDWRWGSGMAGKRTKEKWELFQQKRLNEEAERHLGGHWNYTNIDEGVLSYLKSKYNINTMIDIGCGPGGMLDVANKLGIDAIGIDGDSSLKHASIIIHDYTFGKYDLDKDFDLGWAVEFVEHVDEKYFSNYMDTFNHCRYIVMTSALPNQAGWHHVNCQPVEYWIEKMEKNGFELDRKETEMIKKVSTMKEGYMQRTGAFYRRKDKMSNRYHVSVVIPTCGSYETHLKKCIESILKYTNMEGKEFIVVANGSNEEIIPYVKNLGNNFKLIWFDKKIGVAGAFNAGCKQAKGDFVVLINDDLILLPQPKNQWIDRLLVPFKDKTIGITGHITKDALTGLEFVISFCMMIRREVFENIGYFDEIFNPYYGEDVDFGQRAKKAGWKFGYADMNIYHPWEYQQTPEMQKIVNEKAEILRKRYL